SGQTVAVYEHHLPDLTLQLPQIHVTRRSQQLQDRGRRRLRVLRIEGHEQKRDGTTVAFVDATDGSEVDQTSPTRWRDDDVAGMEVGVEDTLSEHLAHDHEEQVLSDLPAGEFGEVVDDLGGVGERNPFDEVHDDDELARQFPVHVRDMD